MYAIELQRSAACYPPLSALFVAAKSTFSFAMMPKWPGIHRSTIFPAANFFFKEIFNDTRRHLRPCGHMGGVVLPGDKCQH